MGCSHTAHDLPPRASRARARSALLHAAADQRQAGDSQGSSQPRRTRETMSALPDDQHTPRLRGRPALAAVKEIQPEIPTEIPPGSAAIPPLPERPGLRPKVEGGRCAATPAASAKPRGSRVHVGGFSPVVSQSGTVVLELRWGRVSSGRCAVRSCFLVGSGSFSGISLCVGHEHLVRRVVEGDLS
jgi:hypothetical protein